MELVPAGVPITFAAAFDSSGLPVAMSVYETTSGTPVLLLSPFAMGAVVGGVYCGRFTPGNGKSYVVVKAVYTNGSFSAFNPAYEQQCESVYAQYLNSNNSGGEIVGVVDTNSTIIGSVVC